MVPGAAYDAESWEPQAERIAANGMSALAVEEASAGTVAEAAEYMKSELGTQDVAIMGGSVGADAALEAAADDQELADQLILISPNSQVSGLGDCPKLFAASEEESLADTTRQMAEEAPGHDNELLLLPGDAHAQAIFETEEGDRLEREILDRLRERS